MTQIVAELSSNHGGDLGKANQLIRAAAWAGCDYVKIQTYKPEDMPADGGDYAKTATPLDWYPNLFETAAAHDIPLFSSIFAPWAVDFLEQFSCPIYKIASPESTRLSEATYRALADEVFSKTGAKLWASSGIADFEMICDNIDPEMLFFCKKGYPAEPLTDNELAFMRRNAEGFSDHTVGLLCSYAAMGALGKRAIIERHFKLDDECLDWKFSLNPEQMRELCQSK